MAIGQDGAAKAPPLDHLERLNDGGRMFPIRDHNPSERTPLVTYALIALNIAIYLGGLVYLSDERALSQVYVDYGLVPARFLAGDASGALITSLFLHGGLMHLAGNMLFLWIFGDNMEDAMGHLGFLAFYLASGVIASLAHVYVDPMSNIPLVGASGAIAGVMGGYLLLYPKARVDIFIFFIVFFRILPIPAWIMLCLWFAIQIFSGVNAGSGGGIAYWAHAGGFVIGLVFTLPVWLRKGAGAFWRRTEGHPPHPETTYSRSNIPIVRR